MERNSDTPTQKAKQIKIGILIDRKLLSERTKRNRNGQANTHTRARRKTMGSRFLNHLHGIPKPALKTPAKSI
jgi:hypothetical protein